MKLKNYTDKVIVVTGAASGIGAAIAMAFAARGARTALLDFDAGALNTFTKKMEDKNYPVFSHLCDVSQQSNCFEAIQAVLNYWGRIDIMINNAGITQRGSFIKTEISVYKRVMETNFFGSLYCTKAALSQLIKNQGSIVIIESVAGVISIRRTFIFSSER